MVNQSASVEFVQIDLGGSLLRCENIFLLFCGRLAGLLLREFFQHRFIFGDLSLCGLFRFGRQFQGRLFVADGDSVGILLFADTVSQLISPELRALNFRLLGNDGFAKLLQLGFEAFVGVRRIRWR